ncbi:cytochrome P450 315a1, mitochondrial-like [Arctopsyche grandis]|uniref:cytochrome P450 315a1, mitochondrial-like n=1 Tax=Arctopsyche grandis TaxID=121162 RepID=UPI00406D8B9D
MWTKHVCKRFMSSKTLLTIEDLPRAKGLPFIGTHLSMIASGPSRLHKYIDKRHKQLGPIFRDNVGPVEGIFVSDPDSMRLVLTKLEGKYPKHFVPESWIIYNEMYNYKRGLFFMDDEEWLHYRRIMNKLILRPDTEEWLKVPISGAATKFTEQWKTKCESGPYQPKLPDELYTMSIETMLSVMMGSNYVASTDSYNELVQRFAEKVYNILSYSALITLLPAKYYVKYKFPAWKGFVDAADGTLSIGQEIMDCIYKTDNLGDGLVSKLKENGLSEIEMTRIALDFVIAAGDTTAVTTQWMLYLLCKNPQVLNKYRSLLDNKEEEQNFSKGIIKETMRLYPAAAFVARILPNDCELAGYNIPAGKAIILSIYSAGRNPEHFTEPLKFDPRRWYKNDEPDSEKVMTPHASIPFAIGGRSCIGRKIAMLQMKEVLKKVVENFDLQMLNQNAEDIMRMVLVPEEPLKIILTKR